MPLRVFTEMDNQSKYRGRKRATAYRTSFVDQIWVQLAKLLLGLPELLMEPVEKLREIGIRFVFMFEVFELLRAELVAHEISGQTVNTSADVLQLEAKRSPVDLLP
jgi:hypothetical protein